MLLVSLLLLLSSPELLAEGLFCSNANSACMPSSTYMSSLKSLAEDLIDNITNSNPHSAHGTAGTGADKVYGAVLCRGDTTPGNDCAQRLEALYAAISNSISSCSSEKNINLFDDRNRTQLIFSDQDFNSSSSNPQECIVSANLNPPPVTDDADSEFDVAVSKLMNQLAHDMVSKSVSRYETGQGWLPQTNQTVYGLVQCTDDIAWEDCQGCLKGIINNMKQMVSSGQMGGAILGMYCSLWYKRDVKFFAGHPTLSVDMPAAPPPNKFWIWITIGSFSVVVSASWLLVHIWIRTERKRERARYELQLLSMAIQNVINLWRIEEGNSGFSLYDFSQIKEVTGNFSSENKLGQGGFGPVYKIQRKEHN